MPESPELDPDAEKQFLEQLLPWVQMLLRDSRGKHLEVARRYQTSFLERLSFLLDSPENEEPGK